MRGERVGGEREEWEERGRSGRREGGEREGWEERGRREGGVGGERMTLGWEKKGGFDGEGGKGWMVTTGGRVFVCVCREWYTSRENEM